MMLTYHSQDEDKLDVLSELTKCEISMDEANTKIKHLKSWRITKALFLKELKLQSWEDAQQQFPLFADKNKLMKFDIKKEDDLPQTFKVCTAS
jgi:hypothetical protein